MKRILLAILLLTLFVPVVNAGNSTLTPSLTLDQSNPVYGQHISLTGIYGKVYNGRQPQLPNQPQVQVNCTSIDHTMTYQDTQWTGNKIPLGQGWNQSTYYFTLGQAGGLNIWTSGAANCSAVLFYFDSNFKLYQLAFTSFYVAP